MISSKDIIDLMKGTKGLANEMQISMSQLIRSMRLSEMLGATTDDLLRTFAQFKVQAETMEHNKAVFDEAVKQTKQAGALSDPAISASALFLGLVLAKASFLILSSDVYIPSILLEASVLCILAISTRCVSASALDSINKFCFPLNS